MKETVGSNSYPSMTIGRRGKYSREEMIGRGVVMEDNNNQAPMKD